MKLKILLPVSLGWVFATSAQTFQPLPAPSTNSPMAAPDQAAPNTPAAPAAPNTLEDFIQLAIQHNLDVQVERYNPQLSLYDLRIAYAGYDPAFSISGQHDYRKSGGQIFNGTRFNGTTSDDNTFSSGITGALPWGMSYNLKGTTTDDYGYSGTNYFRSGTGSVSLGLTQPLLKNFLTDQTRLNISVAKNRVKFSEQGLRQQVITTVSDVANAYYELIAAQENVNVQQEALKLAEQLYTENKKRVEVGVLAPLDEKQAQSQVAASRAALLTAQQSVEIAENTLKSLITDDYLTIHDEVLRPTESLTAPKQTFNLQDSWNNGLTKRPDLLQAKLDLEQAGIQLKYAKNQVLPELDVFGSYGLSGSRNEFSGAFEDIHDGSLPSYTYGAQLSIPLGNVSARNKYRQGKITVQQSLLAVKKLEQSVMVDVDNAIKTAQAKFESVDATHEARLYAQAALEAEQKKLENGKSTSFVVLQLQSNLTTARSEEIRALADYNEALVTLAKVQGTTLEQRNIDLNIR